MAGISFVCVRHKDEGDPGVPMVRPAGPESGRTQVWGLWARTQG